MDALHVRLRGFTASYSYPFLRSGPQLTLPIPPFSSVLGNLSACAGRVVGPSDTLIAMEFESNGRGLDLETTRRLRTDKKSGRLEENPERGIVKREFHVMPRLDLYLSAINLERAFLSPIATPCLGRSQDLAWIEFVRRIKLASKEKGKLGSTLVRFPNLQVGGIVLPPLADYFTNSALGRVRQAGRYTRYQYVPPGAMVRRNSEFEIFHPDDSPDTEHVVVVHRLYD